MECQTIIVFSLLAMIFLFSHTLSQSPDSGAGDDAQEKKESIYTTNLIGVDPCEGNEDEEIKFVWADAYVERVSRNHYALSATLDYRGDIKADDDWAMALKFIWQNGEDASTKRQIADMKMTDMCGELLKNKTETQEFLACVEGGMSPYCPISSGQYQLKNWTVDTSDMDGVLQPGIWFIQMDEYINDKHTACNTLKIEVKEK